MRSLSRTLAALAAAASLAVLTGCQNAPGYPRAVEADRPEHQLDFATLYGQNCAGCHGPDGRGGAAIALNSSTYLAFAGHDRIRSIAAKGIKGSLMPAFAQSSGGMLTDQQVDVLVSGMFREWSQPSNLSGAQLPPWPVGPGTAAAGAPVYQAACARCHGVSGTGTPKNGHSIVDTAYLTLVDDQSLHTIIAAAHPEPSTLDWRSYTSQPLSSQQIDDLVAWLASHRTNAAPAAAPAPAAAAPAVSPTPRKEKP
jgi:mono/diheme cytochrome c family protein